MPKILNNKNLHILFFLLMPWVWWTILNIKLFSYEWLKAPTYTLNKIVSLYAPERMKYYEDLRWNIITQTNKNLYAKLLYNKGRIVLDEIFNYLAYLSPRYYFQAGDGTKLSPNRVESIPLPLFWFWLYGLFLSIKCSKWRLLLVWLFSAIPALVTGQRNNAYLIITLFLNTIIALNGVKAFVFKKTHLSRYTLYLLFIYCLFVLLRFFLLNENKSIRDMCSNCSCGRAFLSNL